MDYSEVNKRRNFTEFWSVLVDWPTWPQDIVSSAGMLWHAWGSYWCFVIFPFVFHQILWVFCYFIVKIRCMVLVCIKFWLGGRFPFSYTLLESIQQNVARWWMISVIKMLLVERYKQCFLPCITKWSFVRSLEYIISTITRHVPLVTSTCSVYG